MQDKSVPQTRLITGKTRPTLYERLETNAANDDLREFQRTYRRAHPLLALIAWFAESNWRIAAMILGAIMLGSALGVVLP